MPVLGTARRQCGYGRAREGSGWDKVRERWPRSVALWTIVRTFSLSEIEQKSDVI